MALLTRAADSPTPGAVSVPQQFPELQHISDNLVAGLQALGIGLVAACVAIIALMLTTSFGNEHRHALARAAGISLIAGFAILMNAQVLSSILQRIFP